MTWPPRWGGSNFKGSKVASKIAQLKVRADRKAHEKAEKAKVRKRDKRCRFPLCGCKKLNLALHVAHLQHKGSGGNPKGDRSMADKMVLVCIARHKENTYAIDKGTVECRPLTDKGTNGPVEWWMQRDVGYWLLLATEKPGGGYEPFTGWQGTQLRQLAEMNL